MTKSTFCWLMRSKCDSKKSVRSKIEKRRFFANNYNITQKLQSFAKESVFFDFRSRTFFWSHFDLINHQKKIFYYCSSSRWNDFYINNLNDTFNSYMCNLFSKTFYNARFFNDLIQIIWFSSSSRLLDSSFWSSSRLAFSNDRFWNLSYRWKISLHVNKCLRNWYSSDDRMIDFDQVLVHHLLIFIKFTIFKFDFH